MPSRDELGSYPGVYPLGSEMDQLLWERKPAEGQTFHLNGDFVDEGILRADLDPLWSRAISSSNLSEHKFCQFHDMDTLRELDRRIRWCRWRLEVEGLPYDKDRVYIFSEEPPAIRWAYKSDVSAERRSGPGVDALDHVLTSGGWHSPTWYAAKIIAHFRRADRLIEAAQNGQPPNYFGIIRELMLMGETWAEAKFIVDHGRDAIRGKKTGPRPGSKGAEGRLARFAPHTNGVITAMRNLIEKKKLSVSSAAAAVAADGLGTSPEANRKLWYMKGGNAQKKV